MAKKRYSPKERLLILDEVFKNGQKVTPVCKKWQISRFTFYNWAKNWRPDTNLRRESLLRDRRTYGKFHPKAISGKREKLILECVLKNPGWSSHRIESFLKEYLNGAFKVSNHGIANVLNRYGLNIEEARFEYSRKHLTRSVFATKFTDFEKYKVIEEHLINGRKIAEICRQFHISRFTFYAWLKKYEQERTVSSLADNRQRAENHWRYVGESVKQKVLGVVAANPIYSVHKIHAHLAGEVGHHAIQNILAREDLNTFAKRQIFAQGYSQQPQVQVAPLYEVPVPRLSLWRMLFAPFRTVPKWVIKHPASWPIVFPTLAFLAYIFEADKLARPQMFFPIVALTFGFIFFLYSVKYYISLIIVMRLAQSGQSEGKQQGAGLLGRVRKILRITESEKIAKVNPLLMNLDKVELEGQPFVSIHVAVYNEKKVIERLFEALRNQNWKNYEVILADDSTDETTEIAKNALSAGGRRLENTLKNESLEIFVSKPAKSEQGPIFKIVHRFNRDGFKGAALQQALENTNPYADFIVVFDSDFVPYPDTIEQFVKSFQASCGGLSNVKESKIAAVQGYQWHVLNKSENWVTRGVRTEYAGSYVIERAGIGIYGGLNMIAGSVFCLRADVLRQFGWGKSITEDLELTLRLYEAGYKVVFTPYIQTPAEAVSTIKRLIRQRMRWAEGHTFNIRKMWTRIFASPHLTPREKFEFLYLSPYYLQAAFFLVGSLAWFLSEVVLHVRLPFWTAAWGWSLIFTNFLALPLMNLVGLFLEESEERDYLGIASFVVLSYLVVPFQAYAAVKGLLEEKEGPWFRTPKTGTITDIFDRVRFYHWFGKLKIWGRSATAEVKAQWSNGQMVNNLAMKQFNNQDFALATASAYNPFSGYKIRPKRIKFVARGALVFVLTLAILANYLAFFTPQTLAQAPDPTIEQQINMMDQLYAPPQIHALGIAPVDNSLGIIKWDGTKYNSESVYFEAVLRRTAGSGNCTGNFRTTSNSSVVVTSSVTSANFTRVRTVNILSSLSNGTTYTAKIYSSGALAATCEMKAARLIVVQNDASAITDSETQIEVGNNETTTQTAYTQLTDKKIYNYVSTQFNPAPTNIYFEASLKSPGQPTIKQEINLMNRVYQLTNDGYNATGPGDNSLGIVNWDGTKYSGETVFFETIMRRTAGEGTCLGFLSTTAGPNETVTSSGTSAISSTFVRAISSAITLTTGTDYTPFLNTVGVPGDTTTTCQLKAARLIVSQTDTTKITDTRTMVEVGNNETTTSTSYTRLTDSKLYCYNSSATGAACTSATKFIPTPTWTFTAALSNDTSGQTATAGLFTFNASCTGSAVASVAVTGTTWSLPTAASATLIAGVEYEVCIKASANNARIATAQIIIDQTAAGGISAVETVWQQINTLATATNATYSSQTFFSGYNGTNVSIGTFKGGTFTYFFESTLKAASTTTAYAQLVSKSGSLVLSVSSSEVTTTSTSYDRVRSTSLTMHQNIVDQLDTQLKNSTTNTTSAGSSTLIIQATLSTSGTPTASAELYNLTDSTSVTSSEVSSTDISGELKRTASAISLTTAKDYVVRVKNSQTEIPATIASAKIIIDQTGFISALETMQQYVNTKRSLNQTGTTAYARLAVAGGAAVSGSTVSTTSTSYVRQESASITPSTNDYDTEISLDNSTYTQQDFDNKYDSTNWVGGTFAYTFEATLTTPSANNENIASSWLIIQISSLQVPENVIFLIPLVVFFPAFVKWYRKRWRTRVLKVVV